jgi:hypothetical protein
MELSGFAKEVYDQLDTQVWRNPLVLSRRIYSTRCKDPKRYVLRFLVWARMGLIAQLLFKPGLGSITMTLEMLQRESMVTCQARNLTPYELDCRDGMAGHEWRRFPGSKRAPIAALRDGPFAPMPAPI